MHLKSLGLAGFKSFVEAKIDFPPGITAVVGPNGTGKSNLVDAVLWVLGEQSTKTLRSERMEDVIFNGTATRQPLGMAEVSLILSGVAHEKLHGVHALPHQLDEYDEIMITRRLYRNGESEYLVNKTPCRLKDIRGLLLDSRAGIKGHTIIEQGRIDQILNASPQDRRELIEETAGIVRYKKQKAEALRKLEATHQNLVRVRDIIAEVRRQLQSLERQAKQAKTYQVLQQEARALEIRLLAGECRILQASRAAIEAELADLEAKEAGYFADQARLEHDREARRLSLLEGEQKIERIREELGRVEQEQGQALTTLELEKGRLALYEQQQAQAHEDLRRLDGEREQYTAAIEDLKARLSADQREEEQLARAAMEVDVAIQALAVRRTSLVGEQERGRREILRLAVEATSAENLLASLKTQDETCLRRLEQLSAELDEIKTSYVQASDQLRQIKAGREDADGSLHVLRGQALAASEEAGRLDETLRATDETITDGQEKLTAVESRLRALQGVLREEMGYGRSGEEETTSLRAASDGIRGAVAELLVVPPGLERAFEAILGERLKAWFVDGPAQARRAIEFMNGKKLGRGAFVPLEPRCMCDEIERASDHWWPALKEQPGVLGLARDLMRGGPESQALACLFHGAVVVNSLEVAVAQWERQLWSAPHGPTLATIDGDLLDAAGVLTGGAAGSTGGLLLRKREVRRLEEEREALLRSLETARQIRTQRAAERDRQTAMLQRLDASVREAERRALELEKDEMVLQHKTQELAGRVETVETEHRTDQVERARIGTEADTARARLAQVTELKSAAETALAVVQDDLTKMTEEEMVLRQRSTEAQLTLTALGARLDHGRTDLARLLKEQEDRGARATALEELLRSSAKAIEQSRKERDRNETFLREQAQHTTRIREALAAAQEEHSRLLTFAQEIEQRLAVVRETLASSREARMGVEVRRAEIATQLAMRESTLADSYQLSLQIALAQAPDHEQVEPDPSLALRAQLQKVRDRLDRMGPINLAAIEEHRELEERHRFLTTQEEDLSRSVGSLKEIISRINRTTKEMFLETFNELQEKFAEVFGRVFPGGQARLVLTEPEPDEAGSQDPGVEIVAQPPGKRLKNLAMLSGGEKTLTALALILASFLIRPTPFCLLDEIDAALDEENVGRFLGVLEDLARGAQFIVITHNKRTMAIADSLFGVTMEEPGISKLISVRLGELQPA